MIKIKIQDRLIGENEPVFVIAEAGVNHNGDINLARNLIDVAKDVGADAVKFQTFKPDNMILKTAPKAKYQMKTTPALESQYEMLKRLELSFDDFKMLKKYADEKSIIFLSSPFDQESVDLLVELGVCAIKIPSGEITNLPLLKYIGERKLPVILSTGMSTIGEIEEAVETIESTGNNEIILLHCVSNYPTAPEDVNLQAIKLLRKIFQLPVGYSDHTEGIEIPLASISLGARVIEKHFTLNKSLPGPDHKASLNPEEIKAMIKGIRIIEKAIRSRRKKPGDIEIKVRSAVRKSIVCNVEKIPKGTIITNEMLGIKRPGIGLTPKFIDLIVGRVAKEEIIKDELISWDKI